MPAGCPRRTWRGHFTTQTRRKERSDVVVTEESVELQPPSGVEMNSLVFSALISGTRIPALVPDRLRRLVSGEVSLDLENQGQLIYRRTSAQSCPRKLQPNIYMCSCPSIFLYKSVYYGPARLGVKRIRESLRFCIAVLTPGERRRKGAPKRLI